MLSASASAASLRRYELGQNLAGQCPAALFQCIAITGSTARGFANAESDLEINFWVETLPPLAERLAWAAAHCTAPVAAPEPRPDGSIWINATLDGMAVELGWQTWADLAHSLERLLNAQTTNHKELRLADLVISALVLRGTGVEIWQERLKNGYPAALPPLLYKSVFGELSPQAWVSQQSEWNMADMWRVLFAFNRHWEVNWKWARYMVDELPQKPTDLAKHLVTITKAPTYITEDVLQTLWHELLQMLL